MKFIAICFCLLFSGSAIVLEKRSLLDNQIEILVPKDFKIMSKELTELKYPGKNRPKLILTDEDGTTNLAFSILEYQTDSTVLKEFVGAIQNSYQKSFPSAIWKGEGITRINGKKVGYFKVITDARDQKIFNYVFMTDVRGKLMIGTFNCTEKTFPQWEQASDKIVNSLKVH